MSTAFDVFYQYPCNQVGCDYKSTHGGNLKSHLAFIHDIGVKRHECDQKSCSYKAKEAGALTKYQAYVVHGALRRPIKVKKKD